MNSKKGYVGIMVAAGKQRRHVLQHYMRFSPPNMPLYSFTPSSINWKRRTIIGLHRSKGKWMFRRFAFPRSVYNRCYDLERIKVMRRLEHVIGRQTCFNHTNKFNKFEVHTHLLESLAPYLPETILYRPEEVVSFLEKHNVIYLKPVYGLQGKGVYRVERKESGEIHIGYHHFSPNTILPDSGKLLKHLEGLIRKKPYIIQQGIPIQQVNEQTFDLRVLVQKNGSGEWSVTNVVSRIAHKGCYNTSISETICLSEEALRPFYAPEQIEVVRLFIESVSVTAAQQLETRSGLHLGELSVDFALDNDRHFWIIELNGNPQKDLYKEFESQTAVYKQPMQYAHYLSRK
ncbi:YheC/YheD family protein [Paenibacillus sp. HJGM_3]|uniref:YheC/YheD family endospore coat-associated protein n=1 Tax=Paenibacillus sp. HJGM_3 TaxID=3379816 RepID=UPI0038592EE0